eukprot:7827514-Pyramimonas_sp.AAC.1
MSNHFRCSERGRQRRRACPSSSPSSPSACVLVAFVAAIAIVPFAALIVLTVVLIGFVVPAPVVAPLLICLLLTVRVVLVLFSRLAPSGARHSLDPAICALVVSLLLIIIILLLTFRPLAMPS